MAGGIYRGPAAVAAMATAALLLLGPSSTSAATAAETLRTSLTYTQDKAPREISAVLPLIVEKVNRELEGVVDVEVEWTGGLHSRGIGTHTIRSTVTRLLSAVQDHDADEDDIDQDENGRDVVRRGLLVPFEILDTDECRLNASHPMAHKCAPPAFCVNTVGSYECVCPAAGHPTPPSSLAAVGEEYFAGLASQSRSGWELSFALASRTTCPSSPSTNSCCEADAHHGGGEECRASFRCPVDPCANPTEGGGAGGCASSARCARADNPLAVPDRECRCPSGLMGNGKECRRGDARPRPAVMYDGVTATAETVENGFYCGCTKPIVDACAGFPPCEGKNEVCTVASSNSPICGCRPGYVDNKDGYGCVDENPPILKLRNDPDGDQIDRLVQGDSYKEHAVDIDDDNAEEYLRSLKISYSRPLPPGCLATMGQFHVNYTVSTPWTNPPYARVTRTVTVDNIDECHLDKKKYEAQCPQLVPRCDVNAGAMCADTIGSYTCKCPKHTSGDGFRTIVGIERDGRGRFVDAPEGYSGGTGCRDTSKPVIEVLGPNPKVFRVSKCGGLRGIMGSGGGGGDDEQLSFDQRGRYESDIQDMVKSTAGAELCATHARPNPSASDCVRATDHTYQGKVDLTERVIVGEPVRKSDSHWTVPYNVIDDAGNKAATVWRDIIVEEVDLGDLERRIRESILKDKEREIEQAVAVAVENERRKGSSEGGNGRRKNQKCPPCPDCRCPDTATGLSDTQCDAVCAKRNMKEGTCPSLDTLPKHTLPPILGDVLAFFEGVLSTSGLLIVLLCTFAIAIIVIVQRVMFAIFNPRDSFYYTKEDEERERQMLGAVKYHRSPGAAPRPASDVRTPGIPPPRASLSGAAVGNGIFSPPENRMDPQQREMYTTRTNGGDDGIYQTMSPITPSRSNGTPSGRSVARSDTPHNHSYNLRRSY